MSGNFMDIYEIDLYEWDDFIERLNFPDCSVVLECWYDGCEEVVSSWRNAYGGCGTKTNAKIRLKVKEAALIWEN